MEQQRLAREVCLVRLDAYVAGLQRRRRQLADRLSHGAVGHDGCGLWGNGAAGRGRKRRSGQWLAVGSRWKAGGRATALMESMAAQSAARRVLDRAVQSNWGPHVARLRLACHAWDAWDG